MTFQIIFVLLGLIGMVTALVLDKMRPGIVLLSVVILFMVAGVLSPEEVIAGFSNKGMITVALLFLVSEGVRQSGAISSLIKKLLPEKTTSVAEAQLRMLPSISLFSAFLNNTPVVVIFAPIIKHWAKRVSLPYTKFLIPLSYATILGGICTLIGTSTNLVVHGMILESAGNAGMATAYPETFDGFSMFELGKVGLPVAVVGIIYMLVFSGRLLPDVRRDIVEDNESDEHEENEGKDSSGKKHIVEVVLASRFPGLNKRLRFFDFKRHFGAEIKEIRHGGERKTSNLGNAVLREGDTLVLSADESFISTWKDSSVFFIVANGKDIEDGKKPEWKKWFALVLLIFMIVGATIGELPVVKEMFPNAKFDMFFFVCVTTVIMAWTKLFPAKKYTKYISWDILITIACAFAISKAMENSGFAGMVAEMIIGVTSSLGAWGTLAILFIITNMFTELITNNAAAALSFPLALEISSQLGVNPMPFFVVICIAASASFSTPIGYQTNLIVQGIGNYKFTDFFKFGFPLNLITFILTVLLVPLFWNF